jgi:hypothetical protein
MITVMYYHYDANCCKNSHYELGVATVNRFEYESGLFAEHASMKGGAVGSVY